MQTNYGWTDYIGCGDNSFSTISEAEEACSSLRKVFDEKSILRIVEKKDLDNYDLVA
jgi:hypothetical protein